MAVSRAEAAPLPPTATRTASLPPSASVMAGEGWWNDMRVRRPAFCTPNVYKAVSYAFRCRNTHLEFGGTLWCAGGKGGCCLLSHKLHSEMNARVRRLLGGGCTVPQRRSAQTSDPRSHSTSSSGAVRLKCGYHSLSDVPRTRASPDSTRQNSPWLRATRYSCSELRSRWASDTTACERVATRLASIH